MVKGAPHCCEVCHRAFSLRGNLNVHLRTHTGGKPFLCDVCGRAFAFKQGLKLHQWHHTGEKPCPCGVCGKALRDQQSLRLHQAVHTGGKTYSCDVCGKSYSSIRNLRQHGQIHSPRKPWVCGSCGVACSRKTSLRKHIKKFHVSGKPIYCSICGRDISQEKVVETLLSAEAVIEEFVCVICEDPIQKRKRRMNQEQVSVQEEMMVNVVHKEVCLEEDDQTNHHEENTDKELHSEMKSCTEAPGTRRDKSGDVLHPETQGATEYLRWDRVSRTWQCDVIENHNNDTTSQTSGPETDRVTEIVCMDGSGENSNSETNSLLECNEAVSGNETLDCNNPNANPRKSGRKIQQKIAVTEKLPVCPNVGKTRAKKRTSSKPATLRTKSSFTCDVCDKVFPVKGSLVLHQIVHSGEKPFLCNHCGCAFPRKQSLLQHRLRHTGEKPYLCSTCGKSFRQNKTLQNHLLIHTGEKPHICEVCNKAFAHPANFRQHRKIHSKAKPFVCGTCGVVFSRRTSLRKHIKKFHVGGKQFDCEKCGSSVPQTSVVETLLRSSTAVQFFHCDSCAKPV